jgi:endonuclease-3
MRSLWSLVAALERHYGPPAQGPARGPLELILYENVAYLASEDRRERAFRELKKRVGTQPEDLLLAPMELLTSITAIGGIFPELRAWRLQQIAQLVRDLHAGDLDRVLSMELSSARRAFRKFPTIGEPGADKILLFTGAFPLLALESNGVRVLVRFGFAREQKSYSATYRALQNALRSEIGNKYEPLIKAHLLLKRHGQEICRRSQPRCPDCVLRETCAFPSAEQP